MAKSQEFYQYSTRVFIDHQKMETKIDESFESQNKIHTRKYIQNCFENYETHKLSNQDCKIIIDHLMSKYSLKVKEMAYPMEIAFTSIKTNSVINFNSGYFKISLDDTSYFVYDNTNKEIQNPSMQEIFVLFENK